MYTGIKPITPTYLVQITNDCVYYVEASRCIVDTEHDKYVELGYIPSYAYENFCDMYEAYHALGGNGTGTKLYEEIKALHLKNKGDKD